MSPDFFYRYFRNCLASIDYLLITFLILALVLSNLKALLSFFSAYNNLFYT
ncbi:hypothetical protein NEOC84_001397|nr:hypothetical protein [Neochlamydia sp. AcF84]